MTNEIRPDREISILIVEDDDVDVKGVKRALKKLKVLNPTVRARDGIEGLEILRDSTKIQRPYIILLDINMPRMNGLEMLAELRSDPKLVDSIVFVLTTSKADEDKMAAYNKNIAGYIVKSEVSYGYLGVVEMLENYWRIVELPTS
jgi:CheY-like chemotaxis protein